MTTPVNQFLAFATGQGANVLTPDQYAALQSLAGGFVSGILPSVNLNTVLRQASFVAAVMGQFIVDYGGVSALDDGNVGEMETNLLAAIKEVVGNVNTTAATINTTGGSTTLTAAQYGARFITVTGALTSNATLVFPAQEGKWTVINQTTGGYTLTCQTASGTGVVIAQGNADDLIGDGTNIQYVMADAATKAQIQSSGLTYALDTGTANTYQVAYAPAITTLTDGMVLRFRAKTANTGASTFAPNAVAAAPIYGGAHQALQGGEIVANSDVEVEWNAALNSGNGAWVLLGCTGGAVQVGNASQSQHAVPYGQVQTLVASASATYVNSSSTLTAGKYLVDTSGGPITLTLPANPAAVTIIELVDAAGTWNRSNCTLSRNGKTIEGLAEDLVLNVNDQRFIIWFNGSDWRLL